MLELLIFSGALVSISLYSMLRKVLRWDYSVDINQAIRLSSLSGLSHSKVKPAKSVITYTSRDKTLNRK